MGVFQRPSFIVALFVAGHVVAAMASLPPCKAHCLTVGDAGMPGSSCWDIVERKGNWGSSFYWLKAPSGGSSSTSTLFQAYCDMKTEGGGWTLVARITDDYSWLCADRNGENCIGTSASPSQGNLFHEFHARQHVAPEFVARGLESGVHLPVNIVRSLFTGGLKSVRFSFYNSQNLTGPPDNDAVATFYQSYSMFTNASAVLNKDLNYRFHVLRRSGPYSHKFNGERICWLPTNDSPRNYEGGLFMGREYPGHSNTCHMDNDVTTVMLKSHMVSNRGTEWFAGQHSFLTKGALQVPHKAILIWVR